MESCLCQRWQDGDEIAGAITFINCLEIVAVKGRPAEVLKLANLLKTLKGVKHGTLGITSTGKGL